MRKEKARSVMVLRGVGVRVAVFSSLLLIASGMSGSNSSAIGCSLSSGNGSSCIVVATRNVAAVASSFFRIDLDPEPGLKPQTFSDRPLESTHLVLLERIHLVSPSGLHESHLIHYS